MRVIVPMAEGAEEMEAVAIVDVLRRAHWPVVSAGLGAAQAITCSRGVKIVPDAAWPVADLHSYSALVLPGGMGGTQVLSADPSILEAVRRFIAEDKWVAAICAAPLVLQAAGVLSGRTVTCHPSVRAQLTAARLSDDRVVVDGRLVTSQGAGTAIEFALALVRLVDGAPAAQTVARGMAL